MVVAVLRRLEDTVGLARVGRHCQVGERAGGYPKGWVGFHEVGG